MSDRAPGSARPRQRWADVAKGGCIVLVVLWRVTRKDYLQLPWDPGTPVDGAWGRLSELLLPVRMPLFFLVSGLFSARQLTRPWLRVWTARVAPLLYLFVLWTLVHTLVLQLTPGFDTAVATSPGALLVQLTVTPGNLWYLLALAAYVVVARASRRTPHWALGAALLLSAVAAAGWVATPGNRYGVLTNLVWFLLGTRVPHLGGLAVRLTHPSRTALLASTGVLVAAAGLWQGLGADGWFGVRPALGAVGIAAGVTVAASVAGVARLGPTLAALGRRTLPVYVLHLPLVALVHVASGRLVPDGSGAAGSVLLALGYPVVVTAVVLVLCLVLQRLLQRAGATWLFEAPWLPRAVSPARARARRPRSAPGRAG